MATTINGSDGSLILLGETDEEWIKMYNPVDLERRR